MSKKREYVNIFLIFLHFLFLYDKIVKISFGGKFMEEKKNIEVVSGDGSNLEISPVYDHLNVSTPKSAEKKPKYVVIPEEKKKKGKYEDKKEEEN
jgi:hypothetical protein